jgi:hypothetical protein
MSFAVWQREAVVQLSNVDIRWRDANENNPAAPLLA